MRGKRLLYTKTIPFFFCLFLFALSSCRSHTTWQLDRLHGFRAVDSAARLSAPAITHGPKFKFEWLRNTSGEWLFISAYCLDFPESGQVMLQADDHEETFFGYVYMGGQQLLLPDEARDFVKQALLDGIPLIVTIGCYSGVIEPDGFAEKYPCLEKIPYHFMDCCPPRGMM